ncbi:MAG: hypothetical protein K2I47_06940, partial [Odoribacter sp.]|nr:hypothetical protein [Odoribacter sp.]
MMKEFLRKRIPHIIAVLVFIVIGIIYFAPAVLDNKALPQGDAISAQGMGKDLRDYHEETGEYAFWSNRMFGGMPANYTFLPPVFNLFSEIGRAFLLWNIFPNANLVFLYLFGFYIFLISIGCKPWLSVIGAVAYAFATYNILIIEAGHVNKALVMATMAPIIGGVILCYRKKYLWGAIITLIFAGLNIYWNHQQITYYLLIIILILGIVYLIYAIREHTVKDFLKSSVVLLVVGCLAVLPAVGHLLTTVDYTAPIIGGVILCYRKKYLWGAIIT